MEVDGDHTYFVEDGDGTADAVSVHNICDNPTPGFTDRSLQHFFSKHAADFGLTGNWSPSRLAEVRAVLSSHIAAPTTKPVTGSYRGKRATHFVDPQTGLNVVVGEHGYLMGAYRLSAEQLQSVLDFGRLF